MQIHYSLSNTDYVPQFNNVNMNIKIKILNNN